MPEAAALKGARVDALNHQMLSAGWQAAFLGVNRRRIGTPDRHRKGTPSFYLLNPIRFPVARNASSLSRHSSSLPQRRWSTPDWTAQPGPQCER